MRSWALAVAGVGLSTLLFWLARGLFGEGDLALLYLPVVALLAGLGDMRTGVVAAVLSFFAAKFFLFPKYYTLYSRDPRDWVSLLVFLAVGLAMGLQTQRVRRREREARQREQESALLYRFSAGLALETTTAGMARLLLASALAAGGVSASALFLASPAGELTLFDSTFPEGPPESVFQAAVDCQARATAADAPEEAQLWGPVAGADDPMGFASPADGAYCVPLRSAARVEGVLYVAFVENEPALQTRRGRLVAVVSHLAAAFLERQRLQHLAASAEALQAADHLKNVLISSVSHELRTPLASVTATLTSLLEGDVDWDSEIMGTELAAAGDDLKRLNASIGDLLDLSRLESGSWVPKRAPCDLGEILGTTLKRIPRHRRQRIKVHLQDPIPPVSVDFGQWVRALQNLLENALAYSGEEAPIRLEASVEDGHLVVRVEDQGPGVAPEERERVFEKFYRGRLSAARPAGTGLGLAIAKDIVQIHGGRIWVEDARPRGASFVVALPLDAPAEAGPLTPSAVPPATAASAGRSPRSG